MGRLFVGMWGRAGRLLVLGLLGGLVWLVWQWHGTGDDIIVAFDSEPLHCVDTRFGPQAFDAGIDEEQIVGWEVDIVADMRCEVRFHVFNTGDADQTIESVSIAGLGSKGGGGAQAVFINPVRSDVVVVAMGDPRRGATEAPSAVAGVPVHEMSDGVDATWMVDDVVSGNGSLPYSIWVDFRPDGCTGTGSSFGIRGPTATIRNLGWTTPIAAAPVPIWFKGTGESDC